MQNCCPTPTNIAFRQPLPNSSTGIPATPGWSAANPLYVTSTPTQPDPLRPNIEFSETPLYSASTGQRAFRIREYNEDAGTWSLRYEFPDGTPMASPPADLGATAQVNVAVAQADGCANSVPYLMRLISRFDSETGSLISSSTEWVDSSGTATSTMPVGFSLGACGATCTPLASRGILTNWS